MSMNYQPVVAGNQPNDNAGIKENLDACKVRNETISAQQYVLLPLWSIDSQDPHNTDDGVADANFDIKETENDVHVFANGSDKTEFSFNSTNRINVINATVNAANLNSTNSTNSFNTASPSVTAISPNLGITGKSSFVDPSKYPDDLDMPKLEDIVYSDDVGVEADLSNLETNIPVSPIPTTRVYKYHLINQIIEPKKVHQALKDPSWIEAMQEELLQFKLLKVWVLVDLPKGKRVIGSKWVFRNKKDEREIVIKNKARLMDVKSVFLYETIEEGVYVCQPLGFEDPDYPDKVYKVVKALYGLHQAPRSWQKGDILLVRVYMDDIIFGSINKELCKAFKKLMKDKFQMSSMGEITFFLGLQVKQKDDGIFISQDKYVAETLRKFGFTDVKSANTSIKTEKPLLKDPDSEDVDVHIYKSMIGSLMYLTSSRPDIMFAVCACIRFQVTPKVSHLHAVKRIFRYLKGKPHLGFWYPRDSPFNLVAYCDSDFAGASLDRKSTTRGCQFLGYRLTSWQYKKQTIVATSSTEAEYIAATS
nr:hypothetical protein [Tanacetum cinerariifolium]